MTLFDAEYLALCALITLEVLVLQHILKRAAEMRSYSKSTSFGLARGTPLPAFRGDVLNTKQTISERDLVGQPNAILFVHARSAAFLEPDVFTTMVSAVREKVDGRRVYMICSGTDRECGSLANRFPFLTSSDVAMVVDDGAEIANKSRIGTTPSGVAAVLVDHEGYVEKSGHASTPRSNVGEAR